jgi:hypothetical protein
MPGVSHAQRPPRQRLRSNGVIGNYDPELANNPTLRP